MVCGRTVPVEGGPREDRDRICVEVSRRTRQLHIIDARNLGRGGGGKVGSGRGGAREGAVGQVGERRRCCAREAARGRQGALMAERLSCEGRGHSREEQLASRNYLELSDARHNPFHHGDRLTQPLAATPEGMDRQLEDDPAERWGKGAGKGDLLMVKAISSVATSPPINPIGRSSRSEILGHWMHSMASTASK
eukprot:scaffold24963_cov62-Phaeocystis_antarctica.AAC.3